MSAKPKSANRKPKIMISPADPWKVAFAVMNTPSLVKSSSANVCPTSSEFVSTKVKKRSTNCFTSDEGMEVGHMAAFVELSVAIFLIDGMGFLWKINNQFQGTKLMLNTPALPSFG